MMMLLERDYTRGFKNVDNVLFLNLGDSSGPKSPRLTSEPEEHAK